MDTRSKADLPYIRGPGILSMTLKHNEGALFMKSQYLVYPGHGVGKEVKTANKAYLKDAKTIKILSTGMTIVVTKGDYKRLKIRKLMSKATAKECISIMAATGQKVSPAPWATRYFAYMKAINNNDPIELAKAKTDLAERLDFGSLSFVETRMLNELNRILTNEILLVLRKAPKRKPWTSKAAAVTKSSSGSLLKSNNRDSELIEHLKTDLFGKAKKTKPKKIKTYKYQITVDFETTEPLKAYGQKDSVQFENGLPYFAEATKAGTSLNDSFVYGSGKIKMKKLGTGSVTE
jgi:RNA polymerase-interacting CarD/CdnL/TRCF family regulator